MKLSSIDCAPVVTKVDPEKPHMKIPKSFQMKDRDLLLKNYEASFFPDKSASGAVHGKGKATICYPTPSELYKSCVIDPWLSAQFSVAASLYNIVLFLLRDGWLDGASLFSICAVDVEYALLVDLVPTLMKVNFQSLQQPRFDYASQEVISKKRINQIQNI